MKHHQITYEQYCIIKKRNIVLEETLYHNGTKRIRCTNLSECEECGGCKHPYLSLLWEKNEEKRALEN